MAHLAVTVVLLFLTCVYSSPAPEPHKPKFVFVKNSAVGVGVADQTGKTHAMVESNQFVDTTIEAPVDTGDNVPDVVGLDNVNAGAAFAANGNVATGVVKNNEFDDKSTKGRPHRHEPSNKKFTFAKDSGLGLGVARQKSKAHGLVESNKLVEEQTEVPQDTGNVAALDNINAGVAFAASGSIATGVLKNNKFADNPIKGFGASFTGSAKKV